MWLLTYGRADDFSSSIVLVHFVFVNWMSSFFSISCIVLTCYEYYCCIWLGFNALFYFFTEFLLFSPKKSVTGSDPRSEVLLFSSVLQLHLYSCYYCYGYIVMGVQRPSWFTEIPFRIGLLLSKEVNQLKIIIIILICLTIHYSINVLCTVYRSLSQRTPTPYKLKVSW